MTNISNNEDFLKELLSPREPEKAPEGFADRVMAALPAAPARQKASWWQQSNAWIWASIVAGIISLVVIAFTLDFSFMGSIFTGIRFDSFDSAGTSNFSSLGWGSIARSMPDVQGSRADLPTRAQPSR